MSFKVLSDERLIKNVCNFNAETFREKNLKEVSLFFGFYFESPFFVKYQVVQK